MKNTTLFPVFLLISLLIIKSNSYCQGAWLEQATGSGTATNQFIEGGDDCIGYAKKNSRYIYFFDINIHKWITVDLQSEQIFQRMEAKGQVVIAYTDEFIIGYSSITSGFDTLRYEGPPLYPHPNAPNSCSYGCIEKAGYFVTYTHFYVFDGELGKWQDFLYPSHPYDDGAVIFMRGDDYIGMVLPNHYEPFNIVTNMAYSLPKHDVSYIDNAGYLNPTSITMTHGFVTWLFPQNENIALLTGYCSASNTFTHVTINSSSFDFHPGIWGFPDKDIEKNIVVFVKDTLKPDGFVHEDFYAYNTVNGSWDADYDAYQFNSIEESGFDVFDQGASVAAAVSVVYGTGETNYFIYNGNYGTFHSTGPGYLINNGGSANPLCANNVMLAFDSTKVWINNPPQSGAYFANGYFDGSTNYIIGNQFVTVNMWNLSDVFGHDNVHIYNTLLNKAIVIELDAHHSSFYPIVSNNMFAFIPPGADDREVYFYSGLNDSLSHVTLNLPNHVNYIEVKDRIGVVFSNNGLETFLYDANMSALTLLNTSFSSYILGGNFFMFTSDDGMQVYNFTKQEFSSVELNDLGNFWAGDSVGLVSDALKNNYYAYNGFSDSWVPLTAEGSWTYNTQAFNKTAIVVREDRLYAFDPFFTSGTPETPAPEDINSFTLFQNTPNPFTDNTLLSYSLTRSGYVSLKIYDMLGNEIANLVDENEHAGKYYVKYKSDGLPNGIYYCTLSVNNMIKTKKMVTVNY